MVGARVGDTAYCDLVERAPAVWSARYRRGDLMSIVPSLRHLGYGWLLSLLMVWLPLLCSAQEAESAGQLGSFEPGLHDHTGKLPVAIQEEIQQVLTELQVTYNVSTMVLLAGAYVPSGQTNEDYLRSIAREWNLQAPVELSPRPEDPPLDDRRLGVLVLSTQQAAWFLTGSGIAEELDAAAASQIATQLMLPLLRPTTKGEAILAGLRQVQAHWAGQPLPLPPAEPTTPELTPQQRAEAMNAEWIWYSAYFVAGLLGPLLLTRLLITRLGNLGAVLATGLVFALIGALAFRSLYGLYAGGVALAIALVPGLVSLAASLAATKTLSDQYLSFGERPSWSKRWLARLWLSQSRDRKP